VIGVLPPRFVGIDAGDFGENSDDRGQIWLPMREMWTYPDYGAAVVRGPRSGIGYVVGPRMIGRLATGLSQREAEAQAQDILPALAAAGHEAAAIRLTPFTFLPSSDPYQRTIFIGVLMSVPFIVLGNACANVAGIQVARAAGRTHEIAIRMSLGASRYRVARLIAIETGVMAFIAGGLGWLVATQMLRFAGSVLPFAVIPDGRVLMFATALPLLTSLVAGFAPAWRATGINVLSGLRLAPRVGAPGQSRLRRIVVVAQVALSVLLLVVATTLGRSIVSLDTAIGSLHEDVLVTAMRFGDLALDASRSRDVRTSLAESVAALPGVTSTAVSGSPEPFRGFTGLCWANPAAEDDVVNRTPSLSVTPPFFSTLGLSLRRGRTFDARDRDGVVIVNEAFLARVRGSTEVLGSRVRLSGTTGSATQLAQIIGVVSDGYERLPRGVASPRCYVPLDPTASGDFAIFARSTSASTLEPQVQRILGQMDSRLAPREIGTVASLIRARYQPLYWITQALAAVSLIALVLSAVGLFALMSYSVSQRTSEFGIRIALGAHPGRIALGVLRNALALTAVGTIIGIAASIPISLVLSDAVLRTISWLDPGPSATVAVALLVVAALATLAPVSRAWRIDPVEALRAD
jgi:predicted permease